MNKLNGLRQTEEQAVADKRLREVHPNEPNKL